MKSSDLSPHQQAVVESTEASLMVRAAAGSGKTRALVARYLKHVGVDGYSPDELLTLTFTRKAAAEMKRRIVDALRGSDLMEAAQIAETGPIQTLHGFCERMLRENALAAGADPDFAVVDPPTAQQWLNIAIREAIANAGPKSDEQVAIEEFAGKRAYGQSGENSQLFAAIERTLDKLRGGSVEIDQIAFLHDSAETYLASAKAAWIRDLPEDVRAAYDEDSGEQDFFVRLSNAVKKVKANLEWLPGPVPLSRFAQVERQAAQVACGIAKLALAAWRSLENRMREEQQFDFAFLEYLAVHLVEMSDAVGQKLRRQYRALLIDEAQDLNAVQYRLLRALSLQIEMMVGDHQQSIYGFRLADVRLFEQRSRETPTLALPKNYRSSPSILRFVDRLFSGIWLDDYLPMLEDDDGEGGFEGIEWWEQDAVDLAQIAEWMREVCDEEDFGDVAMLTMKTATTDKLQYRLAEVDISSRIAGGGTSFYTRLEVRDLANMLTALVEPTNDFALAAVLRSPLVEASLDAVVLLANRGGIASKLSAFESPIESDREKLAAFYKWFAEATRFADRLPAWELLSKILSGTPYVENLVRRPNGRQQYANARKLLAVAAQKPQMGGLEFARFMRTIQELSQREGDAPSVDEEDRAVTLMTIHKAKGLEFPVVILAETDRKLSGRADTIEVDRDLGLVGVSLSSMKDVKWPIRDWIASKRKQSERAEALRTLYVAMTRAKRRLIIVGSKRAGSLGEFIWANLNLEKNPAPGLKIRRPSTPL